MKKTGVILFCCLLLFFSACFFSCGGDGGEKGSASGAQNTGAQNTAAQSSGALVHQDPQGLVSISIAGGRGEMTLDLDKWDATYNAFVTMKKSDFLSGPFKIITQQDCAVIDAYAGRIKDLKINNWPAVCVILLMENGTVECARVWPYRTLPDPDLYTYGPIPWINDIVAIYGENETVYAKDSSGKNHDIHIPMTKPLIGKMDWYITLQADGAPKYYGKMYFTGENTVTYEIRNESEDFMQYSGYYEIILYEGHSGLWPANSLQLFLSLESYSNLDPVMNNMPHDIETALSIDIDEDTDVITLRHLSGTNLFGYRGVYQEVFKMEVKSESDPTIYPYDMINFLTGGWELILYGKYSCTFDIYYSNFNRYSLDFALTFKDTERSHEIKEFKGGLSSGVDYTYAEINTLSLYFYDKGYQSERYFFVDRGIHKGKRMMIMAIDHGGVQSVFDQLELKERHGYGHIPMVFAKAAGETRSGHTRINAAFNAVFWEFDEKNNTVWLTEAGLDGDEPACVSVEYSINGIDERLFWEAFPGMECEVRTNAQGEVVEFILPMG